MNYKRIFTTYFSDCDIVVNGDKAWDIQVHNEDVYKKTVWEGSLGLGEAYMRGWWDCEALDVLFCKLVRAGMTERSLYRFSLPAIKTALHAVLCNVHDMRSARCAVEQHYDLDNEMFACMLGPTMNYSCGYWLNAHTLDAAQVAKMELICHKLRLREGMIVLDIGCGWGGLARYMAQEYGVTVTAVTNSQQQYRYAREHSEGLAINWMLADYRQLMGRYDRIVSVGMFEHVGKKNHAAFFKKVLSMLGMEGLFLLHTIGSNTGKWGCDPWIAKYIFPHGALPSLDGLARALAPYFVMEDWQNLGSNYDRTLMAWYDNYKKCLSQGVVQWEASKVRMFSYYLLSCAGAFRARDLQVWQVVLSPHGCLGGYDCRGKASVE